ncbi:hypothetical protein HAX54_024756 [Datura stramonium]|uniref:Uncharacterized protein n=1 Tax=Datura stramonium TaxID=4076 RepID=A0ABS8S7M7_DATST|nr:hypothetical protein [Datura stramonium]
MGPLTSSYVLCGSREANEGKLFELPDRIDVHGMKKLVDPNESFFWSLFAPHPEPDPQHNAHALRAWEGNEVQFMRPQRSGVEQSRHFLTLAGSR